MHVVPPDPDEDQALEAVASSLAQVASVMDQLAGQLTNLTQAFGQTRNRRQAELEIGQLFVRAQEHVDGSIADADKQAHEIVAAARGEAAAIVAQARAEADRIVIDANTEAQRIVEDAQKSAILSPEAVTRLSSTIEGFARMNTELVTELSALRTTLAPAARPAEAGTALAAPGATTPADEPPSEQSHPGAPATAAVATPAVAPAEDRHLDEPGPAPAARPVTVVPDPTYPPPPAS
jgi:hypothetical protein